MNENEMVIKYSKEAKHKKLIMASCIQNALKIP